MIAAFSITPLGVGESVGDLVAEAIRVVRASGLPYETNAMFTNIEGEWDEVMDVLRGCVDAVAGAAPRFRWSSSWTSARGPRVIGWRRRSSRSSAGWAAEPRNPIRSGRAGWSSGSDGPADRAPVIVAGPIGRPARPGWGLGPAGPPHPPPPGVRTCTASPASSPTVTLSGNGRRRWTRHPPATASSPPPPRAAAGQTPRPAPPPLGDQRQGGRLEHLDDPLDPVAAGRTAPAPPLPSRSR